MFSFAFMEFEMYDAIWQSHYIPEELHAAPPPVG